MQLHPVKAPTRAKNSPKTRPNARLSTSFALFSFLCAPPLPPFKPFSRPFSLSPLHLPTAPRRNAHARKKRPKAAPSPPLPALNSTKLNRASFKIRPRLNASLNRIKPKLNPIQPFAHFVLSPISTQSTRNSLIYRHSTSFRFNPTLYISFSCPYIIDVYNLRNLLFMCKSKDIL